KGARQGVIHNVSYLSRVWAVENTTTYGTQLPRLTPIPMACNSPMRICGRIIAETHRRRGQVWQGIPVAKEDRGFESLRRLDSPGNPSLHPAQPQFVASFEIRPSKRLDTPGRHSYSI